MLERKRKDLGLAFIYGGDYNLIHATLLLFLVRYKYDKNCVPLTPCALPFVLLFNKNMFFINNNAIIIHKKERNRVIIWRF